MSEQDINKDKVKQLLSDRGKQRSQQRTQDNLHLVSAALTDKKDHMRDRRKKAEEMALEAMRRLRSKNR